MSETGLFTISELARRAGVPTATIKHYVNEELVAPVKRTGKTMAWYNDESVKRVLLVRSLQQERFLPLSVIRRLIGEGALTDASVELDHAIYPPPERNLEERYFTAGELAAETGVSEAQIDRLVAAGVLHPVGLSAPAAQNAPDPRRFSELDAKIVQIVRQREEDGLSFDYSLNLLTQYSDAMDKAVYQDIRLFISMILANPETQNPLPLFNRDDDSVNLFLFYARRKFNRMYVNEALEQVSEFATRLRRWIPITHSDLESLNPETGFCGDEMHALARIADAVSEATIRDGLFRSSESDIPAGPLTLLAEVICSVQAFAEEGALDRRFQELLAGLARIGSFGVLPAGIASEIETGAGEATWLPALVAAWLTGAIYLALPPILGYHERGAEILTRIQEALLPRPDSKNSHRDFPEILNRLLELRPKEDNDD